jgi:hypothetical protein
MDQEQKIAGYWRWFLKHETQLFMAGMGAVKLFKQLIDQLRQLHPSLVVDMSQPQAGKRELILSAEGDQSAFPLIMRLSDLAPPLKHWQIIPFRPKRLQHLTIQLEHLTIQSQDVFFTFKKIKNQPKLLITLYFFALDQDLKLYRQAGRLLVEHLLGEYNAATKVELDAIKTVDEGQHLKLLPLFRLADELDRAIGDN